MVAVLLYNQTIAPKCYKFSLHSPNLFRLSVDHFIWNREHVLCIYITVSHYISLSKVWGCPTQKQEPDWSRPEGVPEGAGEELSPAEGGTAASHQQEDPPAL